MNKDTMELLKPDVCHFCPIGSVYNIHNIDTGELVLFSVVIER